MKLLTIKDIARLYRLSPKSGEKTVRAWLRKGALPEPISYPGQKLLWREDDILDMIKRESAV